MSISSRRAGDPQSRPNKHLWVGVAVAIVGLLAPLKALRAVEADFDERMTAALEARKYDQVIADCTAANLVSTQKNVT